MRDVMYCCLFNSLVPEVVQGSMLIAVVRTEEVTTHTMDTGPRPLTMITEA